MKVRIAEIKSAYDCNSASLEDVVREIQEFLWRSHRNSPNGQSLPAPTEIWRPRDLLEQLDFTVSEVESLGTIQDREGVAEVAGTLNACSKEVQISNRFSPQVKRFTAAHELGHAVLHSFSVTAVLHRDRPVSDGGDGRRPIIEREADSFASLFLMPRNHVKSEFIKRFGRKILPVDEHTSHCLGEDETRLRNLTSRQASRLLSSAGRFDLDFLPLCECFGVSVEAMAIRLEELELGFAENS